jgi:diphthamide biosynthesis methyltransferase
MINEHACDTIKENGSVRLHTKLFLMVTLDAPIITMMEKEVLNGRTRQ